MKFICGVILVAIATLALAEPIEVPNTFVPGTRAVAAEVNENFQAIAAESNQNDARLTALEANQSGSIADQLVCIAADNLHDWARVPPIIASCVRKSDPTNVLNMTALEILQDGWFVAIVQDFNFVYEKYEN
ncbi:MAG: hypothetical protein AAF542_00105 [Pseudomonadota bacterium]